MSSLSKGAAYPPHFPPLLSLTPSMMYKNINGVRKYSLALLS